MNTYRALLLLVGMLFSAAILAEPSYDQAHKLVEKKINSLMEKIEASKKNSELSDQAKIQLVDDELGDVVDFKRIARRVMAKHFRKANKEQKYAFLEVFRSSLLNTYAKGLWEFNNYKINLLPLNEANQSERNTQVGFEVITAGGQVFPVTQSLFYHQKRNQWMVQNVIINGINMGLLFREQFARLVAQHNGDIDQAIANWTVSTADQPSQVNEGDDMPEADGEED